MKEITIEQKAQRYDETIERVKKLLSRCIDDRDRRTKVYRVKDIETIFPELKENEDEKIRKEIISHLQYLAQYCRESMPNVDNWIAWLEKQGEKPQGKSALEAIKEEKVDNANKVEPKFHEGEWITDGCLHCKISDVLDDRYIVDTKFGKRSAIPFKRENNYHLWNVTKDAKEGDVLFHSDSASNGIFIFKEIIDKGFAKEVICYCDYDSEDHFCLGEHHTCCWADAKILHPATKDQRDTLMKAMADAGYTFNFEKKELKKLGQSEVTKMSDQEEIAEIPFGAKDSELQEATYFIPKGFHAEIADDKVVIKKGEKPIEWSYEDEANLNNIIWLCNNCIKGTETTWIPSQATKIKHLIETIKEEGLAQQNSAWSEEDEQIILSIEQVMNCASLLNIVPEKTDKIRTWLKSLKQRIGG